MIDLAKGEKLVSCKDRIWEVYPEPQHQNSTDIRLNLVLPYVKRAVEELNIKDVRFILNLSDHGKTNDANHEIPKVSFSNYKQSTNIVIPNIDFFSGLIYKVIQQSSNDKLFEDKLDSSVFAGANTNDLRIEYCYKVYSSDRDFGVLTHVQRKIEDIKKTYLDYEKLFGSMSLFDQLKHKIVVNIDGNASCWSRLYWQMNSNSVPVYIDQSPDFEQYFDRYDDEDCYFSATMDNFGDVYDYILDPKNIDHVNQVNENGKRFIRTNFAEYMKNQKLFLLNSIKDAIRKVNEKYHKL
jgi:hypothetical protein